ncbi:hypothetical protein CMT30_11950 [Elizabethkingia anophelis]|nr:hypothetical protein [Elizabethkingia anophelis]
MGTVPTFATLRTTTANGVTVSDAKCGDKKTADSTKTKDGKCGDKKADMKKAKTKDGKCGEGKCGGKSSKKGSKEQTKPAN